MHRPTSYKQMYKMGEHVGDVIFTQDIGQFKLTRSAKIATINKAEHGSMAKTSCLCMQLMHCYSSGGCHS